MYIFRPKGLAGINFGVIADPPAEMFMTQRANPKKDPILNRLQLWGENALDPAHLSKTVVVAENILVPAQDGAHDERIIGVADLRHEIWDDVYFFGRISKSKGRFLS